MLREYRCELIKMVKLYCPPTNGRACSVFNCIPLSSVALGACPRIYILFKVETFSKNKHSHMGDITSIVFLTTTGMQVCEAPRSLDEMAFSNRLPGGYPSLAIFLGGPPKDRIL